MNKAWIRIIFGLWLSSLSGFLHAELITPPTDNVATQNLSRLQAALPLYLEAAKSPWPEITTERLLKLKSRGDVVLALRERLLATGDLSTENDTHQPVFDHDVMEAVENFQARHGLKADGVVGPITLGELNVSPSIRAQQIQLNIQRWETLSKGMEHRFILVNIPDYRFDLFDHDQSVLTMKAIIGRPTRQTPLLKSTVTRMVLNPYWDVPERLANKDIVPKVLNDPDYLYQKGIRIFTRQEDNARQLSPEDINWEKASEEGFPYHFRQDPGENNALGLVKFEFPNPYDVYMHDTPAKTLFDHMTRDFSSGCIRLEKPMELVEYFLKDNPDWTMERVNTLLDTRTIHYVRVPHPIPIYVAYFTAWVDDSGKMQFREDIYQKDTANPEPLEDHLPEDAH